MKLIIEDPLVLDGSIEEEINESTGNTERNYYLSGVFSTPDKKNRNGRIYSRAIWEREVARYQNEIKNKTINTLGEWQHPPRSTVDPMKAVMRIVELEMKSDGQVWGKCKILNNNTDETNKIKGLIKEGIKIGVSTRGVGKVSPSGIVEEYKMITADLVDIPSNHASELTGVVEGVQMVNGIVQDKEYIIDENGCIGEECSIYKNENKKEEKCPIQEKIDKAVEEIYENIDSYMKDIVYTYFGDTENRIYENIDSYMKDIVSKEIKTLNEKVDPNHSEIEDKLNEIKDDKTVEKLIEVLERVSCDKEDDDEEIKTCKKCGKELDNEDEEYCEECKELDDEETAESYIEKLKRQVFRQ